MDQQAALAGMARGRRAGWTGGALAGVLMAVLLALLAAHAGSACLDFAASLRLPIELDYGEGIVWQQAALIPGPSMYGTSTALPFIVFHYPPLYHLLARAALLAEPNLLAAGRLVSVMSTLAVAGAVMGLVLVCVRHQGRRVTGIERCCAMAAGLLTLGLHAVHSWGMVMRVDMLAVALGMLSLLVGIRADGRFAGTALALLLCLASVFAKQTQLPAGIAVLAIAALRRPRAALGAGALAGAVGLAALGVLQWRTAGGFLHNIIGANINGFNWHHGLVASRAEVTSFPLIMLMLACAAAVLYSLPRHSAAVAWRGAIGRWIVGIRVEDRAISARRALLLYSFLSGLVLVSIFKSGSAYNYMVPCLCAGCVLIGVQLCDLAADGRWMSAGLGLLLLCALPMPFRLLPDHGPQEIEQQAALVRRIAAAGKPVASEDMTLLMQAGKPVIFEPAITAELARLGRWDEAPLLRMIRTGGFAFMLTAGDEQGGNDIRTASVDAAMREAYPDVEQVSRRLWLHKPSGS